jgi:hypothetical protein
MKTIIFWILIGWILTACVFSYKIYSLEKSKNAVVIELENLKNQKPATIVVKETKVEYKYLDGKKIIVEKVPEGYVKFDVSKYNAAVKNAADLKISVDSLRSEARLIQNKLLTEAANDSTTINKYKSRLKILNSKIKKLESNIITPDPQDFVFIQNKGIIFKSMIGVGYDSRFDGFVGAKLAFWGKYGLVTGSTRENFGIGISRHLYDVLPPLKNTEIMLLGGVPYKSNGSRIFIGLGVGL